jgi:hypothetical protein
MGDERQTENNALVQDLMTRAGGKLPSGTYLLTWTLESDDGGFTSFPMSFTIAGNREAFVRLIAPGAHAGDRADEVNTKFPVFQWTGLADSYTFNLWEDVNKTGNVAAIISLPPMVSARNLIKQPCAIKKSVAVENCKQASNTSGQLMPSLQAEVKPPTRLFSRSEKMLSKGC